MDQIFWKGLAPSNEKRVNPRLAGDYSEGALKSSALTARRTWCSEHGAANMGLEAQHAKSLTTKVTKAHEGNHQNAGFVILRVLVADCGQRPIESA
jgi:hypothetical protein